MTVFWMYAFSWFFLAILAGFFEGATRLAYWVFSYGWLHIGRVYGHPWGRIWPAFPSSWQWVGTIWGEKVVVKSILGVVGEIRTKETHLKNDDKISCVLLYRPTLRMITGCDISCTQVTWPLQDARCLNLWRTSLLSKMPWLSTRVFYTENNSPL